MGTIFSSLKRFLLKGIGRAKRVPPPGLREVEKAAGGLRVGFTGRAGLGGEELEQTDVDLFVAGEMALFLDSSWLRYAKYDPGRHELEVGLINGQDCKGLVASSITQEMARTFAESPSKGSWWWHYVFVAGEGVGRGMSRKTHVPVRWL